MLDLIRKKQKTILVKIVFWVIIATFIGTIFLVWGQGGKRQQEMSFAAQVNGTEISFDDYKSTYGNMYNFYKQLYGQDFTPELEEKIGLSRQAINNLIDQTLLLQEAERLNLSIAKQDLVAAIAAVPAFQVDGFFNKERYLTVLAYQRMKPELFEQIQRRQMLIEMVRQKLQSGIVVSDEDVVAEYRRINEKINVEYLSFAAGEFLDQVKLNAAQIESYYGEIKESLRIPEQVALAYVKLDPQQYRDQIKVTTADIEQYYNRHLSEYAIPEQVSVAHILFTVAPDAEAKVLESKKKLADQVLAKVKADNFADLAQKYSDDKASATNGGSLGFFKRGTMDPDFEDAAFALEPGALAVVKSRFGYHVIKCQSYVAAGFKPLADVNAEVTTALLDDLAGRLAYEKAMDAYNINRKEGGLTNAAQILALPIIKTGLFKRGESIPAIGVEEGLSERAFSASNGQLLMPIKSRQGVFLCEVVDKKASYIPDLADVKPVVESMLRKVEAVKLAQNAAELALKELMAGKALKTQAKNGVKVAETGMFGRDMGGFVPTLGDVAGLSEVAFALTVKNPLADQVFVSGETFYVVRLKQLQPADPNALTADESQRLKDSVLRTKRDAFLKENLAKLSAEAEIVISPAMLRTIEGKN
jgi:peptidyl-prolyl cis-trans isomerase D